MPRPQGHEVVVSCVNHVGGELNTASAFLRLALVYRLRPRWSVAALELIAWADAVLDEPASID